MQGRIFVAFGGRYAMYDGVENLVDTDAFFGARQHDVFFGATKQVYHLVGNQLRIGTGQIYFIEYRNDGQVVLQGQIKIGDSLGFYALRGIYNEECPFAGGNRTRYLVGKIHVAGGIYQIEGVFFAFVEVSHLDSVALDSDAALPLQVHVVEYLGFHFSLRNGIGKLQQPVGKGTFAVVNMGNDTEIASVFHAKEREIRDLTCKINEFLAAHSKLSKNKSQCRRERF